MTVAAIVLAALFGAVVAVLIYRLAVERLWLDVAISGLRRYLQDASGHIDRRDLVLDIGGGDRPHVRADLVCDMYEDSWERGLPLLRDRPLVFGDVTALPFRDKSIDYAICQHLIEHVADPEGALAELQRVAKRGLIRTPSPLAEKLVSRDVHRWFVSTEDGTLVLRQKAEVFWDEDLTLSLAGDREFWRFFGRRAAAMETSHRWADTIAYRVERVAGAPWSGDPVFHERASGSGARPLRDKLRQLATRVVGHLYRRWLLRRPGRVDLAAILACPSCRGPVSIAETVYCATCDVDFPVRGGAPVMLRSEGSSRGSTQHETAPAGALTTD